uniref:Uncharacterized protein n=1 Tax=Bionectria ochroleuca TaxID=29856 RepID=A0A8H7NH15_BIOOC
MAGRMQDQAEESTPAAITTTDISILEKSHGVSVEQKAGPESDTDIKRSATDDEVANLAQTADSLPLAVIIVMIIGGAERFAYYALSGPWQNYIQNPLVTTRSLVPLALVRQQQQQSTMHTASSASSHL